MRASIYRTAALKLILLLLVALASCTAANPTATEDPTATIVAPPTATSRVVASPTTSPTLPAPTSTSVATATSQTPPTSTPEAPVASLTRFYVDSVHGSDANSGRTESEPWQTLTRVQAHDFEPGDIVHLKRSSTWSGGLIIDDSGEPGNPIVYTTYGTGPRPVLRNPGTPDNLTNAVTIYADWVVVQGLRLEDTSFTGAYLWRDSDHNVIRDIEATDVGIGVAVYGRYNLVTDNHIHDLKMVHNTPDVYDDDLGAIGVLLFGSFNEVSYNRLVNCKAPSYDYGVDGGAVELFAGQVTLEQSYIHHNWASGSRGFLEVGSDGGSVVDTLLAYNVSINNGWFALLNMTGSYATEIDNLRVENNTVLQYEPPDSDWNYILFRFAETVTPDTLLVRNNVFSVDGWNIGRYPGFTHDHNLYDLRGGGELGFSPGEGEILADPRFVDAAARDFHLLPGSPAIDAGRDLGYTQDFDDCAVPAGEAPDLGAFEHGAACRQRVYVPLTLY